jgi:hypothetical protein
MADSSDSSGGEQESDLDILEVVESQDELEAEQSNEIESNDDGGVRGGGIAHEAHDDLLSQWHTQLDGEDESTSGTSDGETDHETRDVVCISTATNAGGSDLSGVETGGENGTRDRMDAGVHVDTKQQSRINSSNAPTSTTNKDFSHQNESVAAASDGEGDDGIEVGNDKDGERPSVPQKEDENITVVELLPAAAASSPQKVAHFLPNENTHLLGSRNGSSAKNEGGTQGNWCSNAGCSIN